jgi:hypothetical protein
VAGLSILVVGRAFKSANDTSLAADTVCFLCARLVLVHALPSRRPHAALGHTLSCTLSVITLSVHASVHAAWILDSNP